MADVTAPDAGPKRPAWRYTIPAHLVSKGFHDRGFSEKDRTFILQEIGIADQDRCARNAGGNPSVLTRLMIFASIRKIGDKGRHHDLLESWWDAIGGPGRRLVEGAFMDHNSVGEGDLQSFLGSAEPVEG